MAHPSAQQLCTCLFIRVLGRVDDKGHFAPITAVYFTLFLLGFMFTKFTKWEGYGNCYGLVKWCTGLSRGVNHREFYVLDEGEEAAWVDPFWLVSEEVAKANQQLCTCWPKYVSEVMIGRRKWHQKDVMFRRFR